MNDATTSGQSPVLNCPTWCATDHAAERAFYDAQDAQVSAWLGAPVPSDYTPRHSHLVGWVTVEAGGDGSGQTRDVFVAVERWQGSDAVVRIDEPTGEPFAREDYTPAQARQLARLLLEAAKLAAGPQAP